MSEKKKKMLGPLDLGQLNPNSLEAEIAAMAKKSADDIANKRKLIEPVAVAFGLSVDDCFRALEDVRVFRKFWKGEKQ